MPVVIQKRSFGVDDAAGHYTNQRFSL